MLDIDFTLTHFNGLVVYKPSSNINVVNMLHFKVSIEISFKSGWDKIKYWLLSLHWWIFICGSKHSVVLKEILVTLISTKIECWL